VSKFAPGILDWTGFVKGGIGLVKAKTPLKVLRIYLGLGTY